MAGGKRAPVTPETPKMFGIRSTLGEMEGWRVTAAADGCTNLAVWFRQLAHAAKQRQEDRAAQQAKDRRLFENATRKSPRARAAAGEG